MWSVTHWARLDLQHFHHLILLSINKEKVELPSARPQPINALKVGPSALVFNQASHLSVSK
nr:MAG TPA: hypothetical protein [Crassvirales sp.]